MYIFGGRGIDGKDLGDLAAFKIASQSLSSRPFHPCLSLASDLNIVDKRWYMFQNMGPSPSGRSGHAMASMGTRVFVLGGESFTPSKTDDPSIIHVLDTSTYRHFFLDDLI